ncbi:flagellar assembly protein FliW [Christensenella tenuis]|uniref:Flagellar assembly factor FliW n=1 Tax=Christensenella tenuis TaxID=2763033 RepID=A0ABR7EAE9_9FIRM|nr:flagellar assembly protein FliW [Christensenella tenuis]
MKIESTRFGEIEINENSIIRFVGGLPGFEELDRYAIIRCDQTEPIQWLQSLDDKDIAIPIVNPFILKPDYEIEVDDDDLDLIETHKEEDLVVLSIMVIPEDITKMTANLMAPLLINIKEMVGAQMMMDYKTLPIRFPAFEALQKYYHQEEGVDSSVGIDEKGE